MMTTSNPQQRSAEINTDLDYTICEMFDISMDTLDSVDLSFVEILRTWLHEQPQPDIKVADIRDFKTKVGTGTTASLEGFDALATVVSGGELDLRVVELNEDNLSLIWYLTVHALLERDVELPEFPLTRDNDLLDFELEFVETSSLRELLDICSQINT